MEVKTKNKTASIEVIEQSGNDLKVKVGDKIYSLNLIKVESGVYSVLHKGKSYSFELSAGGNHKNFVVNTSFNSYPVEIIDASARYQLKRQGGSKLVGDNTIVSTMPGKVVKVLVDVGDKVVAGQTVLIISAMKMESEFKAAIDGTIKKINVNDGDTVDANKILIVIE